MTPHTESKDYTSIYSIDSPGGESSTTVLPVVVDSVDCGPITHGDRKSANNWFYETVKRTPYVGKKYTLYDYGDGNGFVADSTTQPTVSFGSCETVCNTSSLRQETRHYNTALSRLNDAVRGGLDLSVDFAEAHSTLRMLSIVSRSKTFWLKLDRAVVAHNLKASKQLRKTGSTSRLSLIDKEATLKAVASGLGGKWLEYIYGWRPLASALYDAATELHQQDLPRLLNFKGSSHDSFDVKLKASYSLSKPVRAQGTTGVRFKISLLPRKGFEIARWTSLNPVSIAWELLPYSFVVDWFYDIGSYLRDLETACAYDSVFSSGFTTSLYVLNLTHVDSYFQKTASTYLNYSATSTYNLKSFSRTVLGSYPLPRAPVVNLSLSSTRLISAASLLSQHLR